MALYSMGPVGFGDKIGATNRSLILRTCRDDGLLLKPTRPFTTIDQYFETSVKSFGNGQVWSSFSSINDTYIHHHFLIINSSSYQLQPRDFYPSSTTTSQDFTGYILRIDNQFDIDAQCERNTRIGSTCGVFVNSTSAFPILSSAVSLENSQILPATLYHFIPVHVTGWAFLGELDKLVYLSPQRFHSVTFDLPTKSLIVEVQGVAGTLATYQTLEKTTHTNFRRDC